MKNLLALTFILLSLLPVASGQIKIIKATHCKTIGGRGGVCMNYCIEVKDKKNAGIEVDSVKAIADASGLSFYLNYREPCGN